MLVIKTTQAIFDSIARIGADNKTPWLVLGKDPEIIYSVEEGRAKAREFASSFQVAVRVLKASEVTIEVEKIEQEKPKEVVRENRRFDASTWDRSTVQKPVQIVWALCETMAGARRKDVVNAAIAQGVTLNTARTQYQYWYTAQKAKK